jgi:hypothetical protein
MKCVAQISNGKVLTNRGYYKDISRIRKGEFVLNMYGKPVSVKNVIKRNGTDLTALHHCWWHDTVIMSKKQELLMWNKDTKDTSWCPIGLMSEIDELHKYFTMPSQVEFDNNDTFTNTNLSPSYRLGYLFGIYLNIGYTKDSQTVGFDLSKTKPFMSKIIHEYLKNLFNITPTFTNERVIECNHCNLFDIFIEFRGSYHSYLPEKYWCKEKDFLKGLCNGIEISKHEFERKIYPNEVSYWAALESGDFINLIENKILSRHKHHIIGDIQYVIDCIMDAPLYSLDVDCPTKSYIVSNMIIKHS